MLQNSTQNHSQSQHQSFQFMRKVCDQIEQQVHLLLSSPSIQDASHLNPKTLQKCISTTKNSIMKAISSRIPQIIAIEDKFKNLILEINKDLQIQVQKNKQIYLKYEDKILECDRYKMETVHLGQMYQHAYQENVAMKNQLEQSSNPFHEMESPEKLAYKNNTSYQLIQQYTQTNNNQYKLIQLDDFNKLQERLLQHKQQRQLFRKQLTENNQIIQEMNKISDISKEKIQQLLEEVNHCHNLIEVQKQNQQTLKKEIVKLQTDLQQIQSIHLNQIQKLRVQHKKQLISQIKQYEEKHLTSRNLLEESKQKQRRLNEKMEEQIIQIKELNKKIKQIDNNLSQKQTYLDQIKQIIDQKNKQIVNLKTKLNNKQQVIKDLNYKLNKINQLSKTKQVLQSKYNKKLELLAKQKKQYQNKCKFYQSQNQRLYQAINQFASKQVKIANKLNTTQNILNKKQQYINKFSKIKQKFINQCYFIQKQLFIMKKLLYGQFQISIMKSIKQFNEYYSYLKNNLLDKFEKKLNNMYEQQLISKQKIISYKNKLQKQYKTLEQKYNQLQSNIEQNNQKFIHQKNSIHSSIIQKQSIILHLQEQLIKQKQFNQCTTNKLSNVIQKYQKIYNNNTNYINNNNNTNYNNNSNQNLTNKCLYTHNLENQEQDQYQLEKQIIQQKNRFAQLQCEYQTLIKH